MRPFEASSIGVLSLAVMLSIMTMLAEARGQHHRGETNGTRSLAGPRPPLARPLTLAPFVNTAPLGPGGAVLIEVDRFGAVAPSRAGSAAAEGSTVRPLPDTLAEARPSPRRFSLTAGLGNMFGGFGVSLERHLAAERLSVAVGFGGLPETDQNPGTLAGAAAVRAFTAGARHRAFAELSASLIAIGYRDLGFGRYENVRRHYGPGLAAGYHYTAAGGFTVLVAAGAGWAVGPDRIEPILTLGAGHTFPR